MFAREVVVSGCMTQFGLKHANQFNQFNFASDIMEPFRPLVDKIIFENRNQPFPKIKRELFTLFSDTFYTTVKRCILPILLVIIPKVVKALNNEGKGVPEFRI